MAGLPESMQTRALLEGLRARDPKSLAQLYDQYGDALYGVIGRMVESDEAAEEILQNVFLKIWRNIDRYDSTKGRFFTWMLNIARHASIDHLRSRQHKQNHQNQSLDAFVHLPEAGVETPGFDHLGLRELVHDLEDRQRQIIDLIYFKGHTQAEAAEALQLPLGTVKSRVRAALKVLRNHMD